MARILTGIQSTGTPHLGNLLGAIIPAIDMANNPAHSFKDKADRLEDVNSGLFSYPMLMAADILLYDAEIIPVGKDQLQHIEMTRDVASRFHAKMGETFVLPEGKIQENTMLIPGTDGEKMSKSRNNLINIFLDDKKLRKQIMSIETDSTPLEEPKNWKTCNNLPTNIY